MTVFVFASLICLILGYLYYRRFKFIQTLPPGPPAWPIVGHLLQLDETDRRKTLSQWHKKCGPVFTVWMGWKPQVIVTGFEALNEVFVKNGDNFLNRPVTTFELLLNGPYGILASSGDRWQEQRRFALQLLRNLGMGKKIMEENIVTQAEHMVHAIEAKLHTGCNVFDVTKFFELPLANVISQLVVSKTFSSEDDLTFKQLDQANRDFESLNNPLYVLLECFPWLRHVPLFGHFGYDEIIRQRHKWTDLIRSELEERKETFVETDEPTDFASAYLKGPISNLEMARKLHANEAVGFFDEWQMICVILDMWNAGYEPTLFTMAWLPLLMIWYPDVQRKVQDELDNVVGRNRMPTMSDRLRLPYTNAVLLELLRYSNIVAFNDGRVAKNTITIAGRSIPEGVTVIPYIAAVHLDETLFYRPEDFLPERFLEPDGKTLKKSKVDQVVQFSLGKRNCVGEGLAKMELFLFFTALMQNFLLAPPTGDEQLPSLVGIAGMFVRPQPYQCKVTTRP